MADKPRREPPRRSAVLLGFVDGRDRATRAGMHHSAFEYNSFTDLNTSYLRLRDAGIEPDIRVDHGMTLSY